MVGTLRHYLFLYVLILFILTTVLFSGCESAKDRGAHLHLFIPFVKPQAIRLSQNEAIKLVAKLSPAKQKMKSWKDLSFAVQQSIDFAYVKQGDSIAISKSGLVLSFEQLAITLEHLKKLLPDLDSSPELLASEFVWFRVGPDFGITGYYEPTLYASKKFSSKFSYPLYSVPDDLQKGIPYHTREEIDRGGVLNGKDLELAWVNSDIDAFFLHIQGSGRLQFSEGSVSHVLYAGKNNREYKGLGRIMYEEGLLDENNISMQSIRETLNKYPSKKSYLFDQNPSYVFFRESEKGPVGSMGKILTPWVSVATDRNILPHGALAFMISPMPDPHGNLNNSFYGLVLPQDTGGAIKKNRIDLFCGHGREAEHTAGYLDAIGAVYLLVKKDLVE